MRACAERSVDAACGAGARRSACAASAGATYKPATSKNAVPAMRIVKPHKPFPPLRSPLAARASTFCRNRFCAAGADLLHREDVELAESTVAGGDGRDGARDVRAPAERFSRAVRG